MALKPRFEMLPWSLRQGAVATLGYLNRRRRFGEENKRWLDFIIRSNNWSAEDRQNWQKQQLLYLIQSAQTGTDYYNQSLPARMEIESLQSLEDVLRRIPVLEKSALRNFPKAFRNRHVKESNVTSTSGSTGSPMQVGHDVHSIQRRFAFLTDHLRLAGVKTTDPSVRLSGRILCDVSKHHKRPWLYNPAENQLFLSSYHLDHKHAPAIGDRLHSMAPALLDGYPSGILELLRLLDQIGRPLKSLKAIITTAETLHSDLRQELTELSGVPVMDYYAASEGVPIIQQCPYGIYHVRWQSGIFEVDDGVSINFDGDGELICTSFVQNRTPLIRYRTGDMVQGLRQSTGVTCECGLNTPTVEQVQGRVEDVIKTSDGRALGMFTYRTLKYIKGLGETQVVQRGYADFEVNTTIREGVDRPQIHKEIKESFERALGYTIALQLNWVEKLPRGPNGKLRLVISRIPRH